MGKQREAQAEANGTPAAKSKARRASTGLKVMAQIERKLQDLPLATAQRILDWFAGTTLADLNHPELEGEEGPNPTPASSAERLKTTPNSTSVKSVPASG